MSGTRAVALGTAFLLFVTGSSIMAQTRPAPATTAPATRPVVVVSPEVQALLPAIREGEALYRDMDLSYRYTMHNIGPVPEDASQAERTVTYLCRDSRWFSDLQESSGSIRRGMTAYHRITSWDGQFYRIFMESLDKDDRIAMVTLGAHPVFPTDTVTLPFFVFCLDPARPLADHFATGLPWPASHQQITRLSDASFGEHRCVRIQIAIDVPALPPNPAFHVTHTWFLLADAHYLPVRLESLPSIAEITATFDTADLKEIAPGMFFPTEVTVTIGNAQRGRADTWTFDSAAFRPDLPADKLANIPIPVGTTLMARKGAQQIARAQTDALWNLRSAAAFLLDPNTTTRPAKAPSETK